MNENLILSGLPIEARPMSDRQVVLPSISNEQIYSEWRSKSASDNEYMLTFLRKIEGFKTKLKELHWAAMGNSQHVRIDEYLAALSEYQDEVAENLQGFEGQIRVETFTSIKPTTIGIFDTVTSIRDLIVNLRRTYKDVDNYIGIINATEDFHQVTQKYLYLLLVTYRGENK